MTNEINVRIKDILYYHGDTSWNYSGVIYPYNTIYIVLDGDGHVSVGNQTTHLIPGFAYLIPAGLRHKIWCDTHIEKIYADAYAELVRGNDVFKGITKVLSIKLGLDYCKNIQALYNGDMRARLQLKGALLTLIAKFLPEDPKPLSAKTKSLLPIITYIEENLSMTLKRDEIAKVFGWNQTVLSRTFSQVLGIGLKQYIDSLLGSRIAEELLLTDKPLKQIADELDFCDAYYLSGFFKKQFGASPSKYRKNRADFSQATSLCARS